MKNSNSRPVTGGGLKAIKYVLSVANQVGSRRLAETVRSKNTCKACAFGTGGQRGGLRNEFSNRIEICNKNIQAHLSDIRPVIPPEIFRDNSIEELRQLSGKQLEDLGRLGQPLFKSAGASHYRAVDYEYACDLIGKRMKATRAERSFFYASGRSSNEAAFILQLLARVYGSNHVNNCSYYCHQASGAGLASSIGTSTATIQYQDLHQADLFIVAGANPASNHPRFVKTLIECRQRGGKVIVINPVREAGLVRFASPSNFRSMITGGTEVASHYLQPHIGGDIALFNGIAKAVLETGGEDSAFVTRHCNHFDSYRDWLEAISWEELERRSGVEHKQLASVARLYCEAGNVVFAWGMGLTHHGFGTENVESLCNLALLRGMVGGPGRGLLPLRGHSNVQGVGSMGFTPSLKSRVLNALTDKFGLALPEHTGLDTLACLQAAQRGEMDFAFLLGGNLYSASPDAAFTDDALSAIPFRVMVNSTLNQTHVNGTGGETLILPVRVRDEERQPTTQESMFSFLRMSDGGFNRIDSLWSEVEIITAVAQRVIPADTMDFGRFRAHRHIRETIAEIIPGFAAMADIDETREEFHIDQRHLSEPVFPTANGKASFRKTSFGDSDGLSQNRQPPVINGQFMLTTVRSEGQFNTIIYNESDVYRRQTHRRVIFMNPQDMEALKISEGDKVDLVNDTGSMPGLEVQRFDIRSGNVMTYYPEANILVPQHTDPRSQTPGFKSIPVFVKSAGQV